MKKVSKKSLGGQLLQVGASMIPGVGPILSPLIGIADQQIDKTKLEQQQPAPVAPPIKITNPYGKFAKGGSLLNDMFKQYDTGSHDSGDDLRVAEDGTPDPNGANAVQGTENSFRVNGKQYVMSNVLKNPKTGNTFNVDAAEINKKYPHARTSLDQRNALDFEMTQLAKINDAVRTTETTKKAYGGPLLNKAISDAATYWNNQSVPAAEQNMFTANTQAPAISNDFKPLSKASSFNFGAANNSIQSNPQEIATDTTSFGTELTPVGKDLTLPQSPSVTRSVIEAQPRTTADNVLGPSTANAIGLGMKSIALAGSVYDALQPAEKEKLILPNYNKADNYMKSANIDYTQAKQDAVGASNIAANMNRSLSSNTASFQGREQSRIAQLQDALGRISEGENNAQSQLNLTKGQYEEGKAVDTANRQYQNQQGNMQNQAAARLMGRNLMSDLSQIGSSFNEYAETQKIIQNNADINKFNTTQALSLIQAKYPGWTIDPKIIEDFKSGKMGIDEFLTYGPGTAADKVKIKKELEVKPNG